MADWYKRYFSGEKTKQSSVDSIHYYYDAFGYKIYPIYNDIRHNKVIGYNIIKPNGESLGNEKRFFDAKRSAFRDHMSNGGRK